MSMGKKSRARARRGSKIERGRWTSTRKAEVVLRLLRGEDLDAVSRELGVSTSALANWRNAFLEAGRVNLMAREPDARDEEIKDLRAKVGELTIANELLNDKIDRMEQNLPPASRRPRR